MKHSHWLIVYYRTESRLLMCDKYADWQKALKARFEWERYFAECDVEIVVLSADSLDTVKRTHGRYFAGLSEQALENLILEWP